MGVFLCSERACFVHLAFIRVPITCRRGQGFGARMSEVRNENTIGDRSNGPRAWGGQHLGVHEQRLQERPAWLVCVRFSAQRMGRAQLTKLIDDTKGQAASYRAPDRQASWQV